MTPQFWRGFEKNAIGVKHLPALVGVIGAMGGAMTAGGVGLLARARYEEKFKEDEDKTLKDKLVAKAPLLAGLAGTIAGSAYGAKRGRQLVKALDPFSRLSKRAALKPGVHLKDHQERAIGKLIGNDGSLLAAHATGSGKTLTGIAGFERLREGGKAGRAIVVVPAGLRENFVDNLKKFTNSTYTVYGPKGSRDKHVGDASNADYNIVSYELFREHGDKIIQATGADTLIMDEVHRARGTEGVTYNKLRELRPKFKNAITLTGSIVNNEPSDVVPLLDITYMPTGHKLVSRGFFDKLFVQKDAKTQGLFSPKVHITKSLKNKPQLAKYLGSKIDFVSHKDLDKDMPVRELQTVEVQMTPEQKKLYDFTLTSVDPITRWKIRNNLPVGQREAKDAFSKLMQARQISTDPAVLDKKLESQSPAMYSPKVKAVVQDVESHLAENPDHKTVIFGNLLVGQLNAVERELKNKNIEYAKFVGLGNEGQTAKTRPKHLQDFMTGGKRVLLVSGAGAEGLDLKNTSMMQMLEGHYNPERIQQAESRVRRMGAERNKVLIKRYTASPGASTTQKVLGKILAPFGMGTGSSGIDKWIYSIAEGKDKLNEDFRDVLQKTAILRPDDMEDLLDPVSMMAVDAGRVIGAIPGALAAKPLRKRRNKEIEAKMKQMLLDRGHEALTQKKHYSKIMAESKLDERGLDAAMGIESIGVGLPLLAALTPGVSKKIEKPVIRALEKAVKVLPMPKFRGTLLKSLQSDPFSRALAGKAAIGLMLGASTPVAREYAITLAQRMAVGDTKDLDIGIQRYTDKLRKKMDSKYKSSKGFVQQYETKDELGIDQIEGV